MKAPHILKAKGNIQNVIANIEHVIGPRAKNRINKEIENNARQMFQLGMEHYTFAKGIVATNWRQSVSRAYYACYNISRAIRFYTNGEYDTTPDDHKKSQSLPDGINNKETHQNKITSLRTDRNLCDYDHTAIETELIYTRYEAIVIVEELIRDARAYMLSRGVNL